MSTNISTEERLSALLDNEITAFESRRLTDELLNDQKHQKRWISYHLIGDVLRNEMPERLTRDFAARVMQVLDVETIAPAVQRRVAANSWSKPVMGLALAASVAAISIFGLQFMTQGESVTGVNMAATQQPSGNPSIQPVAVQQQSVLAELPSVPLAESSLVRQVNTAETAAVTLTPAISTDPRMDSYLATHAEYASRPGMLSRVRIVGYSTPGTAAER
jgi:negative regulator of sigma E activity